MKLGNSLPQTIQNWAQSSIGALSSGFSGLLNSSGQHNQASKDLMDGFMGGNQHSPKAVGVTVDISNEYHRRVQDLPGRQTLASAESNVATLNEAGVTYSASARLIKATSTMVDALFDAVA